MTEWVAIAVDETEEPVEIPTESDGTINLASVTAQFPGVTGLKFRHPETNKLRGVRVQGTALCPPSEEEGWGPYTYLCVRPVSPKKDESGLKRKTDNDGEMYSKNIRYDESDEDEGDDAPVDLIVLGLPFKTSQETIREFFSEMGELSLCLLKTKPNGESRGFAFIRFRDKEVERKVCLQRHSIDGRWCDIKVPDSKELGRDQDNRSACKIFVGSLTEDITSQDLKDHFENFGRVKDVYIPTPFRHFAFVQFADFKSAKKLQGKEHEIKGVKVRIGQATPKNQGAGPGEGGQQNQFGGGGGGQQQGQGPTFGFNGGGGFGSFGAFGGGTLGGNGFGGGGYGGPAGPSNLNMADLARFAMDMGYGSAGGMLPQGPNSRGGGGRMGSGWGGDLSRSQMNQGRRSHERRY